MARNIVLLVLDTVRKDFFDKYATELTARSSVSFEQCRAASSWSVPSHASILTGRLPSVHGVHTHNPDFTSIKEKETFLDSLSDYEFYGVSANFYASGVFGFDGFFDEFIEVAPHKRFPQGLNLKSFSSGYEEYGIQFYLSFLQEAAHHERPMQSLANGLFFKLNNISTGSWMPKLLDDGANSVCKNAVQTITNGTEPFFLFANLMDAHGPHEDTIHYDDNLYSVDSRWHSSDFDNWEINTSSDISQYEEDIENHRQLYVAAIDYLDRRISRFVDRISKVTDRETTIVITSDHGENLGYEADESLVNHTSSLSESILHVPCIVINPPMRENIKESRYFSQLMLGDFLVGLADAEYRPTFDSSPMAETIGISGDPDTDIDDQYWDRAIRATYRNETKIVWDSLGEHQWYKLNHDRPCWQQELDMEDSIPKWAQESFVDDIQSAKTKAKQNATETDLNDSTAKRLQDLGYI